MRWSGQQIDASDDGALPGMEMPARMPGLVRSVTTPEFTGITFHEVLAKSALNHVPEAAALPFRWTINPYRGCSHACRYCFARNTHTYLDLDAGADFDQQVVEKVNISEVLARELGRASWGQHHVALGTNTDPYQRAEGRYQLMPGIISALHRSRTPFSVLTKGTLLLRDLPLLVDAARDVEVSANVSVGSVDEAVWREIEPGTPSPLRRLEACRRLNDAGIGCGVLMAPVLPGLTDSEQQLRDTVDAVAAAGATHLSVIALHLRPGAREWYLGHIRRHRPDLLALYEELYPGRQAYAPQWYRSRLAETVHRLARQRGIGTGSGRVVRTAAAPARRGELEQLRLI